MTSAPIHLIMLAVVQEQDVEPATRALEPLGATVFVLPVERFEQV